MSNLGAVFQHGDSRQRRGESLTTTSLLSTVFVHSTAVVLTVMALHGRRGKMTGQVRYGHPALGDPAPLGRVWGVRRARHFTVDRPIETSRRMGCREGGAHAARSLKGQRARSIGETPRMCPQNPYHHDRSVAVARVGNGHGSQESAPCTGDGAFDRIFTWSVQLPESVASPRRAPTPLSTPDRPKGSC